MALTPEQVRSIAEQARLALTDEETTRIADELGGVLEVADRLRTLDLESVEPTVHVLPDVNVWRDDVARPSLDRDAALAAAPDVQDGFVKVPRVIEE